MLTQAVPEKKELPIAEKIITIEEPAELTAKQYKDRKTDEDYRKKIVKGDLKIGLSAIRNNFLQMEDFLNYGIDEVTGFERLTQDQQEIALLLTFDDLQTSLGNVAKTATTGCLAVSYYVKATDKQHTVVVNLGMSSAHSVTMTPEGLVTPAILLNTYHDVFYSDHNRYVSDLPEVTFSEEKRNGNKIPILVGSLDKLIPKDISQVIQENALQSPAVIANKLIDSTLTRRALNHGQGIMLVDDHTTASIAVFNNRTSELTVSKSASEQVYPTLQKYIQMQLNPEPGQEEALKKRVLLLRMPFYVKQGKLDFFKEALAADSQAVEDELSKLNKSSKMSLFFAALSNEKNQDLAIYFLSKGAKKEPWPFHDEYYDDFNTPLMWAARFGNKELVALLLDLLLKASADLNVTNAQGKTAWQLAKDYPDIQKMISHAISLQEKKPSFEGFSSAETMSYPGKIPDTETVPAEKLTITEKELKFNNPYTIYKDPTGEDQDFCRLYTKGPAKVGATRIKADGAQQEDALAVAIDEIDPVLYSKASPELRKALHIVALDKIQRKDAATATTWVDPEGMFHADIACAGDSLVHCFLLNSDGQIQENFMTIEPHKTTKETETKPRVQFVSLNGKLSAGQEVILIITSDGIKMPREGIARVIPLLHKESEDTISNLLADINYKRYPQDNAVVIVMRANQAVKSALVCDGHKRKDLTMALTQRSYSEFAKLLTPPLTPGSEQAILHEALVIETFADLQQGKTEHFMKTWSSFPGKMKLYVEKLDDIAKNNLFAILAKDPKHKNALHDLFPQAESVDQKVDKKIEVVTQPTKTKVELDIKKAPSPQPQKTTSCNLKVVENKTANKMQLVIEFKKAIDAYLFLDKIRDGIGLPKNIKIDGNKVICNLRKTRTGNEYALDFESNQTVNNFLATLEQKNPRSQLNPFHSEEFSSLQYRHAYHDGMFITHESLSVYDPPLPDDITDRELFYQEKSIWLPVENGQVTNPLFTKEGVTIHPVSLAKFTALPAPLELKISNEIQKSIVCKLTLPGAKSSLFSEEKRITQYLPYVNLFRAKDKMVIEFDSEEKLDVLLKRMPSLSTPDSKITRNSSNKKQLLIPFTFKTGDKEYLIPLGDSKNMTEFRTLFNLQLGSFGENCLKEICTLSNNGTESLLHFPKKSAIFNIPGTVLKLGIPPNSPLLQPKPMSVAATLKFNPKP